MYLMHQFVTVDKIEAMIEGLRRVKRRPQCEKLVSVIRALERLRLHPEERLIIERQPPDTP